jgi:alpha-L-rhamnosidase
MLNQTTYPGWGFMVKHGATTIWELWNGNTANPAMNSEDHVMFIGDMLTWLFQYVGGIQSSMTHVGFKHIIMRPHVLGKLTWVRCRHRSPYGLIVSNWKISGGKFNWHIQIPPNSAAIVYIPAATASGVELNGAAVKAAPWIKFVRFAGGRAIYQLESGNYRFTAPMPSQ